MNVLGMINRSRHVHPGVLIEDALDSSKCIECGQVRLGCALPLAVVVGGAVAGSLPYPGGLLQSRAENSWDIAAA